jgi:hypothetical protein
MYATGKKQSDIIILADTALGKDGSTAPALERYSEFRTLPFIAQRE